MKGYGLFFYPIPLTIDRLDAHVSSNHSRVIKKIIVLGGKNEGVSVATSDDALLCIFGLEREEALRLINTIFAVFTLNLKITCFSAKRDDLVECSTFRSNMLKVDASMGDNLRNHLQFKRSPLDNSHEWKMYPRKQITVALFESMVRLANDFYDNIDIHRDALLLSDGFTLYHRDELNSSFLYAWMMIETFLTKIWGEYVKGLDRTKKDKESLVNPNSWTAYQLIEMFAALNMINSTTRDTLNELRIKRNDIIHKRKDVTKMDTQKCLATASQILSNRQINENKPFRNM